MTRPAAARHRGRPDRDHPAPGRAGRPAAEDRAHQPRTAPPPDPLQRSCEVRGQILGHSDTDSLARARARRQRNARHRAVRRQPAHAHVPHDVATCRERPLRHALPRRRVPVEAGRARPLVLQGTLLVVAPRLLVARLLPGRGRRRRGVAVAEEAVALPPFALERVPQRRFVASASGRQHLQAGRGAAGHHVVGRPRELPSCAFSSAPPTVWRQLRMHGFGYAHACPGDEDQGASGAVGRGGEDALRGGVVAPRRCR